MTYLLSITECDKEISFPVLNIYEMQSGAASPSNFYSSDV